MNIEITIPVLNEEKTLQEQVNRVLYFLNAHLTELASIVVVIADNGSTDATQRIAEILVNENASVKYIRLQERGVGRALKASWTQSSADIIGYMDLDLATDLKHLQSALLPLLNRTADIVTGSRLAEGSHVIGRSSLRNFTSIVFNKIVQSIFKSSFSDGMCGFKFLRRDILDPLMKSGAQSDGWFFATELLVASDHLKYKILDLPVVWTDDPNSKVKILNLTFEYLFAIWRLKRNLLSQVKKSNHA